ncbi:hypothetical protein ASPFODRAFT_46974 [Aspergillus luchuensis CBS 106.47]|uniref:Deoxyribonuclease NucA/NucB domain-containing protein n=1 Tax=Aspergillus luchuensis (strain CBS 106.47) TaxID=1137211 RepID=A0A1M3TGR9_ASPLC|nr:hypothetical protein ASPFODRAFT_46974 [Aspergillus luchuensis CBS 106.47]
MKQLFLFLGFLALLTLSSATYAKTCASVPPFPKHTSHQHQSPLTTPGTKCKRLGTTLTWDKPSRQVSDRRSREAGCGSSNRCSKSPYGRGYQCDEYPFRSVRESDRGGQVNRCVLARYNNAQGQVLRNFYNSRGQFQGKGCNGTVPCRFSVSFTNASRLQYCKSRPNCTNDGNEYTKRGPARRDVEAEGGTEFYRLESGMVLFAPGDLEIGEVVYRTGVGNWTVFEDGGGEGGNGDWDRDGDRDGDRNALEDDDSIQVDEDRIVGVVDGWEG